jgi:2TM family of unknown function (DUF5676)
MTAIDTSAPRQAGVPLRSHATRTIPVLAFGMSLSLFFVISYVICIIGYLVFPTLPINHAALAIFLPGFELLSWPTFLLGLVESFVWGWYIALIFGPLYNFFVLLLC